jgi:hypothetical protein
MLAINGGFDNNIGKNKLFSKKISASIEFLILFLKAVFLKKNYKLFSFGTVADNLLRLCATYLIHNFLSMFTIS